MDDRIQKHLDKYIKGFGLEIGHGISPLVKGNVVYADPNNTTYKGEPIKSDFKYRMENLGFEDNHFDFVVFGDVLEHLTNPIKGLNECRRVLKNNGILFGLIPDKSKTFDRERPITTLQHCIDDYADNISVNDDTHWQEWVDLVLKPSGQNDRIPDKERQIANGWLHHHCFTLKSVLELFKYVFFKDKILCITDGLGRDNDKILIVLEVIKNEGCSNTTCA